MFPAQNERHYKYRYIISVLFLSSYACLINIRNFDYAVFMRIPYFILQIVFWDLIWADNGFLGISKGQISPLPFSYECNRHSHSYFHLQN